ncbi:MAG: hypothetical protein KGI33_12390 [Thaumarchaeota archaeon]|nr:hypothetical protein [Nitrososphaerota archaeon]
MKTLYLSIIVIVILSLLPSVFPSVKGIGGQVLFMKTNSIAKIYANFTFPEPSNRTWNLSPGIYAAINGQQVSVTQPNFKPIAIEENMTLAKQGLPNQADAQLQNEELGILVGGVTIAAVGGVMFYVLRREKK